MSPVTGEALHSHILEVSEMVESNSRASIYRVPEELHKLSKSAYTPQFVSIGPLHSQNENLKKNSNIKKCYVTWFLNRMKPPEDAPELLGKCLDKMRSLLQKAKNSYAEKVDVLDEEMLVIDGCFILEVLYSNYKREPNSSGGNNNNNDNNNNQEVIDFGFLLEFLCCHPKRRSSNNNNGQQEPLLPASDQGSDGSNNDNNGQQEESNSANNQSSGSGNPIDPIDGHHLREMSLKQDLLLLENQLPYFVLNALFELTLKGLEDDLSLDRCVSSYFTREMNIMSEGCSNEFVSNNVDGCEEPLHILDFIHKRYVQQYWKQSDHSTSNCKKDDGRRQLRSASELSDALISFEARKAEPPLLKFQRPTGPFFLWWDKACFEIPSLCVYDNTELFLRNLIAFEQCCPDVPRCFTWYACLMDILISSEEDVKVLEQHKVIRNHLGDRREAADFFNKLSKLIVPHKDVAKDEDYMSAVDYSDGCCVKNIALARRKYFASPWALITFLAGLIVFAMTVIQFAQSFNT